MSADRLSERLAALDEETLDALHRRSMLITSEWSVAELDALCTLAEAFEALDRAGVHTPLFPDELHLAVFFDASTRTKSSWAGAAARLGARPLIVDGSTTQVSHGETPEETGTMLGMNAHALGVRHDKILGEGNLFMRKALAGLESYLEESGSDRVVPLVNLQCDVDHPTQTLADLCWLRERFGGDLEGLTVAVSWAYSPTYAKPLSVPQGLLMLLPRFGVELRLAHPEGYELDPDTVRAAELMAENGEGSFTRHDSMAEAFEGADVVYPKSWGPYTLMRERVEAYRAADEEAMRHLEHQMLARNAQFTDWICDDEAMGATAGGDALYMHCLPADIGAEVSPTVIDRHRLHLARQANKKVYVVMALLAAAKMRALPDALHRLAPSEV